MSFACRLAAACLLVVGCQGGTSPGTRKIVPHRLPDCEVEETTLVLAALGDFSALRAADVDLKSTKDTELPFDLRGIEASTSPPGLRGVGYAEPPEDVHLTMWSTTSRCVAVDDYPVPESQGGQAITAFDDGGAVIIAGLDPGAGGIVSNSAFAMAWDTRIGKKLPPTSMGAHRVAWATATPFGPGALIAGGIDRKFFPLRYLDSALVFRDGAFREPPISIGDARAHHGAVVLASGATLLIGGEDERGVIDTLVAMTPSDAPPYGTADVFMLGSLTRPRKLPTVMRLSTDEILVAGGTDNNGNDVPTLEWFSKEGARCTRSVCTSDPPELAERTDLAFIALTGGGALAVGGLTRETGALATDIWWIGNDGAIERLRPLTPQQRGTKTLRLVAAGDGAPWLWNGNSWSRFDPWQSAFVTPDETPEDGPDDDLPAPVAVDPGLFVWLARKKGFESDAGKATLHGFRYGVRGPFTHDPDFLLADPRHMAPSRPPRLGGELFADAEGLHLSESAGVVISDTTYGDVVVSGDVSGEVPSSLLPTLTIGDLSIGPPETCPWPAAGTKFTVTRRGRTVVAAVGARGMDAQASRTCTGPEGRVTLGLRGLGAESIAVKQLSVSRR